MSPLRQFADIRVFVLHQRMIKLNVDEFLCFHSFNESINQVVFFVWPLILLAGPIVPFASALILLRFCIRLPTSMLR